MATSLNKFGLTVGTVLFVSFCCLDTGSGEEIVVSKKTTYITKPLAADGLPDFKKYLIEHGSRGITPDNNAAVPLWRAIWPDHLLDEQKAPLCKALGIAVPEGGNALVAVHDKQTLERISTWLAEQYPKPPDIDADSWQADLQTLATYVADEAVRRPWTSEQIPPLVEWQRNNEEPLGLILAGCARPKYFSPSPTQVVASKDGLVDLILVLEQNWRRFSRALNVIAMWHLGEGRPDEAWKYLRASLHLAQLFSQGWTEVQQLVGIAIEREACEQIGILLHDKATRPDLAKQVLQELQSLPCLTRPGKFTDQGERLTIIDQTLALATGRNDSGNALKDLRIPPNPDWTFVLIEINLFIDRMVAAMRLSASDQRWDAWAKLEDELSNRVERASTPSQQLWGTLSKQSRNQMVADAILFTSIDGFKEGLRAKDRGDTRRTLTLLSAALTIYRCNHDEYPVQLQALEPTVIPKLPNDLYSDRPFRYQRKPDGGYLLYSVGENGVDDDGTNTSNDIVEGEWIDWPHGVDPEMDDLVIRVPVLPFRVPKPLMGAE